MGMGWFFKRKRGKGAASGLIDAFRCPSPFAPGLTRTGLLRKMEAYVPLASAEPPPAPAPKKPNVSSDTIWQFWWQGEAAAPAAVRTCLDSVRQHAGSRPVVLIDSRNVRDYLDIPRVFLDRFERKEISVVVLSDYIRVALLSAYGGTWIDPTVWVSGTVPPEAMDSEFFVFASPYWTVNDPADLSVELLGVLRFMSNRPSATLFGSCWWMSARPGALPPRVAKRLMEAYWSQEATGIDYLLPYDLMTLAFLANPGCQEVWRRMPKRSTTDAQMLLGALLEPYDGKLMEAILARSAVHKLTHKIPEETVLADMFYRQVFKN